MATTWIVAADASRARILQVMDRGRRLAEIDDLLNPEGRLHERDLVRDAHPRFRGTSGPGSDAHPRFRGTSGPGSDREEPATVEHGVEVFAKTIGQYLDKARTSHRYQRLHLVAPPKFLGQLRKELGKEVQKLVAEELPKDLSWLNARDLEHKLLRSPT